MVDDVSPNLVGVVQVRSPQYPVEAPYHPHEKYPEYPFGDSLSSNENAVYDGIRELFHLLGYDKERFGSSLWNPLGGIIETGMTVVIKPNFVLSKHSSGKDIYSIITHPSVLRALADYCWIALHNSGKIIFADAPQYDCNFQELLQATRLDEVSDFYAGYSGPEVRISDLRRYWSSWKHFASLLQPLPGDKEGNVTVRLGRKSALYGKEAANKLYGAVYNRAETIAHHSGPVHDYELSATVMKADVVISVPKLKVHKKVGVTLNAKGLVGVSTNKNYLVHYTLTPPSKGGDQYPDGLFSWREEKLIRLERWMYDHLLSPRNKILEYIHRSVYWLHNRTTKHIGITIDPRKRLLDAGNWYGNDSAWRMTVDLLRAFYYADSNGVLHDTAQRRTFSLVDGVIGGENNGPLAPDPKSAGILLAGENLIAVDLVASRLMGFDPLKMQLYCEILKDRELSPGINGIDGIKVVSSVREWERCFVDMQNPYLDFKPHPGWAGHLEVTSKSHTGHKNIQREI